LEALGRRGAGRLRGRASRVIIFAALAVASAAYHALAFFAALRKSAVGRALSPAVSILKPVRGRDDRFLEAIRSHARQDYPEFEILFGTTNPADPARADIERLASEYPHLSIRLIDVQTDAPNAKVGVLEKLAEHARFPVLLINDSDILVASNYLQQVVAPLANEKVGLVTCLYRGSGGSLAARAEALGIATEFAPSVLVARQIGFNEFAMGSTLALRASDLKRIGGFHSIRDFLADDYQLGKQITALGLTVVLGGPVVETSLGSGSWKDVWKHQLRWSRTIRISRAAGYFGYAITVTLLWSALAAMAGYSLVAATAYLVRWIAGAFIAGAVLKDREALKRWWWMPARDAFGLAVWVAGTIGRDVEWRGMKMRIDSSGRIV
jgi:ceramide glucosyltransferase